MAIQTRNTLKNWFETRDKPTQQQFWDWLDSAWLRGDSISIADITGLSSTLNALGTSIVDFEETSDTYVAVPAGSLVDYVLIVPQEAGDMVVNLGTSDGDSDLIEEYVVENANPQPMIVNHYFKEAGRIYISGFNQSCIVKIKYK